MILLQFNFYLILLLNIKWNIKNTNNENVIVITIQTFCKCFRNKFLCFTKTTFLWSKYLKQKYCEIILPFKIFFLLIWIYFKYIFFSVMQSWIFSIITLVFSVTWSFRNHSNMLICCSRNIIIIIIIISSSIENSLCCFFVEPLFLFHYFFCYYFVIINSIYLKYKLFATI